jgi:hypothetical protein
MGHITSAPRSAAKTGPLGPKGGTFPDVDLAAFAARAAAAAFGNHRQAAGKDDSENESPAFPDDDEENNDEMLEITPEVQMFFGSHFLAGPENGDNSEAEGDVSVPHSPGAFGEDVGDGEDVEERQRMRALYQRQLENGYGAGGDNNNVDDENKYSCRLCGKASGNGASLFAHLLYPHYAHLWREEIPHRAPRYDCTQCTYTTVKRQHFVMHVARVHDELRKKLAALGENLEVLTQN